MTKVIGDRVRVLRESRGMNQSDLARKTGIVRSQISRIEKEERPGVGAAMIGDLAQALGTTVDYLLGLTDDPSQPARFNWRAEPAQLLRLQRLLQRLSRLSDARQARVMDAMLTMLEVSEAPDGLEKEGVLPGVEPADAGRS